MNKTSLFGPLAIAAGLALSANAFAQQPAPRAATTAQQAEENEEFPPNAEPGSCYARCLTAARYETYDEQAIAKEESKRIEVAPAVYEASTEQVTVKNASKRLEVVPAVYETITEQVLIKEASKRIETTPAVYDTVSETVEVAPATTHWEKGKASASCLSANPDDCRVWCLVKVPAKFKSVTKTIVKSPAATHEIEIPAEYKTVTRTVVKTPATTREIEIPAEYRTVPKTVVKTAASTREVVIPAVYQTVTRTRLVKPAGMTEWTKVLCDTQVTRERMRAIQEALKAKGYDPGPFDNVFGTQTKTALLRYQKDNNLPQGALDVETLKALGVE
jgi:hypothetical protein